ncbi:MAG: J domain-containing protein [Coriobacteriales bacterium]|nr:J domain-containing protein [Coriobacteriales bacterium]
MTNTREALEQLRKEIRQVRDSILTAIVRMDDIKLQQIPQIRADYALKIGCWEQALLEAELAGRRAKRRLALAQAQANRGETPHMDKIEAQLDQELATWMVKAEQARLAYEHALAYLTTSSPMGKSAAQELKRLYRMLAKRLHPDICANNKEDRAALFQLAQVAYHNGNLEALRSLEVATRHLDAKENDLEATDDPELLAQELELARIEENIMLKRLDELKDCEEMRLGRLLANPDWVTARTTELRRAVEDWEQIRDDCNRRLKELGGI